MLIGSVGAYATAGLLSAYYVLDGMPHTGRAAFRRSAILRRQLGIEIGVAAHGRSLLHLARSLSPLLCDEANEALAGGRAIRTATTPCRLSVAFALLPVSSHSLRTAPRCRRGLAPVGSRDEGGWQEALWGERKGEEENGEESGDRGNIWVHCTFNFLFADRKG